MTASRRSYNTLQQNYEYFVEEDSGNQRFKYTSSTAITLSHIKNRAPCLPS